MNEKPSTWAGKYKVNCKGCGMPFVTSPNPKMRKDRCETCRKDEDDPTVYVPQYNGIRDYHD